VRLLHPLLSAGFDRRFHGVTRTLPELSATARGTGILPVNLDHGRDGDPKRDLSRLGTRAHATVSPDGVTMSWTDAGGQACETKPICVGREEDAVPCGMGI
jgi:hypothetical protein